MSYTNLIQLARNTQQDTDTLQLICDLLNIPVRNNQIHSALTQYVEEVCRLHKDGGMELEDAAQQVLSSMPAPSDRPEDTQTGYNEHAYTGETQDPAQVAMAIRARVGGVLEQIHTQGNALLAQVDDHIVQAAGEFNAQLEARPNLFWLAVAEGGSEKNEPGAQVFNLLQGPISAPQVTGRLNRRALSTVPQQNLLVG